MQVLLCFSRNGLISVKKVEALLDLNMGAVDILFGKSCLIQVEHHISTIDDIQQYVYLIKAVLTKIQIQFPSVGG